MRKLNIAAEKKSFPPLPNIPEEFKFVETNARMCAKDFRDLERFYQAGLAAAINYKEKCVNDTSNRYERFVGWVVKQTILRTKHEATNDLA